MFPGVILRSPRGTGAKSQLVQTSPYRDYQQNMQFRQAPQAQTQGRVFMSSLATLYGDGPAELEHRRRQQEQLADSLRHQIEEKRRLREIERKRMEEEDSGFYKPITMETVANQANRILTEMKTQPQHGRPNADFARTQPIKIKFNISANLNEKKFEPPPIKDFAATLPAHPVMMFNVSTDSPFDHSSVSTPPLGFSLRKSMPTKEVMFAPEQRARGQTKRDQPMRTSQPARILNTHKLKQHQHYSTAVHGTSGPRLGTNSELIYPDGHVSAVSSPR